MHMQQRQHTPGPRGDIGRHLRRQNAAGGETGDAQARDRTLGQACAVEDIEEVQDHFLPPHTHAHQLPSSSAKGRRRMTGIYEKEGAERLAHQDSLALSVGGEKQKLVNEGRILLELELRCLAADLSHLRQHHGAQI